MSHSHNQSLSALVLITLSLLVATTIPSVVPRVHGQSSPAPTLYITPANTTTLPPLNTLVTFNLSVTNIPAITASGGSFSGWDILVVVGDRSLLNPMNINLIEMFGGSGSVQTNCVNGVGTGCTSFDGGGIVHSAVTTLSGPFDSGNLTLFSVTFKSTSSNGYTSISIEQDGVGQSLISDSSGSDIPVTVSGAVYGNSALAPVALFSWSPTVPYAGDPVTVNASLSYSPTRRTINLYEWGSETTTIPVTTLIFSAPGNYTVTLTVRDDQRHLSLPVSHIIKVNKKPITDLNLSSFALSQYYGILPGTLVRISPTVTNSGTVTVKFFNVTLKLGDQVLAILQNAANLTEQQRQQFSYTWDTSGLKPDSYTISAIVSTLPKDNNTQDKAVSVDVTIIQPMGASAIPVGMLQLLGIIAVSVAVLGAGLYSMSQRRLRKRQREMEAL